LPRQSDELLRGRGTLSRASLDLAQFSIYEKTEEQIKEAEALLAAGKPLKLMLIPSWWVISARTFWTA
jgi:hypothetical protein